MALNRRELAAGLAFGLVAGQATAVAAVTPTPRPVAEPLDILDRVDPELREGAVRILERPLPEFTVASLAQLRAFPPLETPPSGAAATTVDRRAPGRPGQPEVGFQWIVPTAAATGPRPALIHIHGGGYILGRVTDTTAMCEQMAAEFDCLVANVDYRLAPETPFPGPMEDCYAVLEWVHANADELGVDRTRIAVMGESAGGGLAAMTAIAARDRGEIPLCYQVLIYPMLDDRTGSAVRVPDFIGTIGWNEAGNRFGWSSLLGQPAGQASAPYGGVPARIETLAGLPPTFIGVGGLDLFVDENLEYGRRLVAAGVPTRLHLTPGAYHGFDFIAPESRASRSFTAAWKEELGRAFSPSQPAA